MDNCVSFVVANTRTRTAFSALVNAKSSRSMRSGYNLMLEAIPNPLLFLQNYSKIMTEFKHILQSDWSIATVHIGFAHAGISDQL